MKPVGSVVLITLCAAYLLAAGVAWGAVTGVITGTVTDAATTKPLSGANVYVISTDLSTVTEPDGSFTIVNVPPGPQCLTVSMIGYTELKVTDVVVTQGQQTPVKVCLQPALVVVPGSETVVTAPRVFLHTDLIAPAYVVTSQDAEISISANSNDRHQFTQLVFTQPGVVPDNTFYPHIRGARANQVGYFLDGIPITEPDGNVFATNVVDIGLDRLELFTGSYPIEYGGFTGGIINEVIKRGDQECGGEVDLAAGSPSDFAGLTFEAGAVDRGTNWYVGDNVWHSNFNDNLFTSSAPIVQDVIAKVIVDPSDCNRLTFFVNQGYARYDFPFSRDMSFDPWSQQWVDVPEGPCTGRQGYDISSLGLNHTISPEAFWNLRFSRVGHFLDLDMGDDADNFWQQRNERMWIGQFDYQRQAGPHRLSAGLWRIDGDNNSRFSINTTQDSPFGLLDSISDNNTTNLQAYLGDKWQYNDRLLLALGVRHDGMNYHGPEVGDVGMSENTARGGATYTLSPRLLLRAAAGSFVGFPRADLVASGYVPHASEDPDFADWGLTWDMAYFPSFPLRPELDREQEVGFEWKLSPDALLSTSYFQRQSDQMMQRWQGVTYDENGNPIPSYNLQNFDPDAPVWYAANGRGTTRGLEVKLDRKLSEGTRYWISYTYMNVLATAADDNQYPYGYSFLNQTDPASLAQEYPVDWNQRHTAAAVYHRMLGKWSFDPWFLYGSGFPYGQSGLDLGGSDPAHVPNPNYDPNDPNSGPAEYVIKQNYVDPNDPSKGFIKPNTLMTSPNYIISLNLGYCIGPNRQLYIQCYNLTNRSDVTSYVWYHPRTGGLLGSISGDTISYVPWSRTPPRTFTFGIKQAW